MSAILYIGGSSVYRYKNNIFTKIFDDSDDDGTTYDILPFAENNVWAVGDYWITEGGFSEPYSRVIHYNGTTWSENSTLSNLLLSQLRVINGISDSDFWIGNYHNIGDDRDTMYHWNGTTFTEFEIPLLNLIDYKNRGWITGLLLLSPTSGYACGQVTTLAGDISVGTLFGWKGSAWASITNTIINCGINGICGTDSTHIWLCGQNPADVNMGLIIKYNGTNFITVLETDVEISQYVPKLNTMFAISATDIWAAGPYIEDYTSSQIWHGDGSTFVSMFSFLPVDVQHIEISSIWGSSTNNVYFSGYNDTHRYLLRWNGTTISIVWSETIDSAYFYGMKGLASSGQLINLGISHVNSKSTKYGTLQCARSLINQCSARSYIQGTLSLRARHVEYSNELVIDCMPEELIIEEAIGSAVSNFANIVYPESQNIKSDPIEDDPLQNAYQITLPANSIFPNSITWWDSITQNKLIETDIIWKGAFFNKIIKKIYSNGMVQTIITDLFDYTNGTVFNPKIIRTIT